MSIIPQVLVGALLTYQGAAADDDSSSVGGPGAVHAGNGWVAGGMGSYGIIMNAYEMEHSLIPYQ